MRARLGAQPPVRLPIALPTRADGGARALARRYTDEALNASLGWTNGTAQFGAGSPYALGRRADHAALALADSGGNPMATLEWNQDMDQHRWAVSRHLAADGFLSYKTSVEEQRQNFVLGDSVLDAVRLDLRVGRSWLKLTPNAADRSNCTEAWCNDLTLQFPDPLATPGEPPGNTTISFAADSPGQLLTDSSLESALESVGALRIGSIGGGDFGNVTASLIETDADIRCASDATAHGTLTLNSELVVLNGDAGATSALRGVVRSQIIVAAALNTTHSTSPLSEYAPPVVPHCLVGAACVDPSYTTEIGCERQGVWDGAACSVLEGGREGGQAACEAPASVWAGSYSTRTDCETQGQWSARPTPAALPPLLSSVVPQVRRSVRRRELPYAGAH
eukprot:SAG11_NODE_974_length_6334_cov_29.611387_2_plen_393_part_00